MNNLTSPLVDIGLSKKESNVYLALLSLGSTDVSKIAQKSGIKRPTAYLILDELRKKGLVIKIPHAKRAIYKGVQPDELYNDKADKLENFRNILPKLRSLNIETSDVDTLYFEGLSGLKDAMYYKIDELEGTDIVGFWAAGDFDESVLTLSKKWNADLIKRKIGLKGFTPDHSSTRAFSEMFQNDIKLIPENMYSSETSIDATKLFIRIIDLFSKTAVIIENPKVAQTFNQIFKIASLGFSSSKVDEK